MIQVQDYSCGILICDEKYPQWKLRVPDLFTFEMFDEAAWQNIKQRQESLLKNNSFNLPIPLLILFCRKCIEPQVCMELLAYATIYKIILYELKNDDPATTLVPPNALLFPDQWPVQKEHARSRNVNVITPPGLTKEQKLQMKMQQKQYIAEIVAHFPTIKDPHQLQELQRYRDGCVHFYHSTTNIMYTLQFRPRKAFQRSEDNASTRQFRRDNFLPI